MQACTVEWNALDYTAHWNLKYTLLFKLYGNITMTIHPAVSSNSHT